MLDRDSQKQEVSENSIAIQANGNVNLGMRQSEVKEFCQMLLDLNFPKLKEAAVQESREYVEIYSQQLFSKLSQKNDSEDVNNRLRSPDVQASINDSVMCVARKTKNVDISVLSTLVCDKIESECESTSDLILTEAIRLIDKLNKQSMAFCAFLYLSRNLKVNSADGEENVINLDNRIGSIFPKEDLLATNASYLKFSGICTGDLVYSNNFIAHLNKIYNTNLNREYLDAPLNEENGLCNECPNIYKTVKGFGFEKLQDIDSLVLTVVGAYIGIAYLKSKGLNIAYPMNEV